MTAHQLKHSILQMAYQGKLVEQRLQDTPIDLTNVKKKITEECEFDLPESWLIGHLESITSSISTKKYQILESQVLDKGNFPVISQSKEYSIGFSNDESKLFKHSNPVVIFGDHTTEVKLVDFDFVVGADGVKIFSPIEHIIIPKFLFYVLCFLTYGLNKVGGYSRHYKYIKNKPIPLPPLSEQQRIVSKIEELLPYIEAYEKAETQLTALNTSFPDMLKKSILQEAVQGKLVPQNPDDEPASVLFERIKAEKEELIKQKKIKKEKPSAPINEDEIPFEIPESWEWRRLGSVCINVQYGSSSKSQSTGKIPVLRMGNIQNGKIVYDKLVYTSDEEEIEKYKLEYNDLLFNRTNSKELVGKTGIYKSEMQAIYAGYLVRITPLIDSDYLNYILQTQYYWIYCQTVRSDAIGQSNINAEKLKNFMIPIPPLSEQKRIVAKIEELMPMIESLS